jgi:hypothetical protein
MSSIHDLWRYSDGPGTSDSPGDIDEILLHRFPEKAIELLIQFQPSTPNRRLHLLVNVHQPHRGARQYCYSNCPRQRVLSIGRAVERNDHLSKLKFARRL